MEWAGRGGKRGRVCLAKDATGRRRGSRHVQRLNTNTLSRAAWSGEKGQGSAAKKVKYVNMISLVAWTSAESQLMFSSRNATFAYREY